MSVYSLPIQVKKRFDEVAGGFDYYGQTTKLRAQCIKNYLSSDSKILDVGIGDGGLASLYHTNQNIVGIDISSNMLKIAKQRAPYVKLVSGDGQHLPFGDETFSCVVSSETMYYADNPIYFLQELYRVIRKGGRVIIISRNELWHFLDGVREILKLGRVDRLNYRAFYPREFKEALWKAGFKKIETKGVGVFPVRGFEFLDGHPFLERLSHLVLATGIRE